YSLQPSVLRLAQDRAEQYDVDTVREEIIRRLRDKDVVSQRGDFARVTPCPSSSAEVLDEPEARLVILSPEFPHAPKSIESEACKAVAGILNQRGSAPRTNKNALAFLTADKTRVGELEAAVRQYLAWTSIQTDAEALNLDKFQ